MRISIIDKTKIVKLFNGHALNDFNYNDLIDLFGKNKYSDYDYLMFFLEQIINSLKNNKVNEKLILKYLNAIILFLKNYDRQSFTLKSNDIIIFKSLLNEYHSYLKRNDVSINREIEESIECIHQYLNENYISAIDSDATLKLNAELEDLRLEVKNQESKLQELQNRYDLSVQQNAQKKSKIEELQNKIKDKQREIQELEAKLKTCEEELLTIEQELNKKEENYEDSLSTLKHEFERSLAEKEIALQDLKLKYHELENIVSSYCQELDSNRKIIASYEEKDKRNIEKKKQILLLEKLILENASNGYTLEELKDLVNKQGIDVTEEEVYATLLEVQKLVNLKSTRLSLNGPVYQIMKTPFYTNMVFPIDLEKNKNCLELVFTSDYHISDLNYTFLNNYEKLINYCVTHNIHFIVHGGDFFDFGMIGYTYSLESLKKMQSIVDDCILRLPYEKGIYQGVLGGNHDEWNMYLGIDFLTNFINNREDYLSLGYRNAELALHYNQERISSLLVAHPHKLLDRKRLSSKVHNLCLKMNQPESRYDFYFLGHSHESYLDLDNHVCVLPSFSMDHFMNGAWHVKLYYDNQKLNYIELCPLVLERKLKQTSSIIYRK